MTLLVRDEADIVEHLLVYHLNRGLDHVLAIDDGSTDGTREILDSFQKVGLLTLVPRPAGTYWDKEAQWQTQLARRAATEHGADWILPGDADEFWWPLWGDLKDVLSSVRRDHEAIVVPRNDFVFVRPPARSAPQDFTVREKVSALRPKLAFRASPAVAISQRAHHVSLDAKLREVTDTQAGRPLRVSPVAGVRIFHYGVRSDEQFERVGQRGVRGRGRGVKERAAHRDALYRCIPAHTPFSESGGSRREEVLSRGLAEGELVVDDRLALLYGRCPDPRQLPQRDAPFPPSPEPHSPTAVAEMLDVQSLIIDSLQSENAKMRGRIARLNRAIVKERHARERGPLSGARRALAKLRKPATGAICSWLQGVTSLSPQKRGVLIREAEVRRWYAEGGEDLRLDYRLEPTSRVWDIGGYEGGWAAEVVSRYGCRVDVFEPAGAFADALRQRFCHDDRVTVHEIALGGSSRLAELGSDADASSLFSASALSTEEVRVVDVASQLAKLRPQGSDVDLVKINIEGAEYELLERLLQTGDIRRFRHVLVQFHPDMPGARRRMRRIQAGLRSTHALTWQYRFVWENWERR